MKKNQKNPSKSAATMMRKLDKKELEQSAGGSLLPPHFCFTCGLLSTNI
jgi:hypothetical protein